VYLFAGLKQELAEYLPEEEVEQVTQAYILSRDAHHGQKRRSGEPYITHPVAVAQILCHMRLDYQTIMAAILHDTIEDTDVTKELLQEKFGPQVADLVEGVSKLTQIKFENREMAQAENFRKMMMAVVEDIRVIMVKLADRLHNMRTLDALRHEKRQRIAMETLTIYAPIALRLGINTLRVELEDLGFSAMYPMRSRILAESVKRARGNRKEIISKIQDSIGSHLSSEQVEADVIGREKHLYSIYLKMRDKHRSFSEVMDVYGFRIIVDNVDTCYRVLGMVHHLFKPVPKRFKDYIATPKVNGYQSLHTTMMGPYGVPIEVQIRTRDMDHMANSGVAAHWLYKSTDVNRSSVQLRAREWMRGILELQKSAGNSLEFIENVKADLFPDEVYVFSPNGQIFELPKGATPVDFAYAVHTDVGNSCVGVKINKRVAALNAQLITGQTVEVVTSPGAKPNHTWLGFVVTGKARSAIRHYIKHQRDQEALNLGRRLVNKALGNNLALEDIPEDVIEEIVKHSKQEKLSDILIDVGLGSLSSFVIAKRLLDKLHEDSDAPEPKRLSRPLAIRGTEGMLVTYGKCCRPIPGDPVVGVFGSGTGIVIHTSHCKNVNWQRSENFLTVQWEDDVDGEFPVEIWVDVINQRGVLARLAGIIADSDSDIINTLIEERDGRVNTIQFILGVRDRGHLAQLMRRLRVNKSVIKISRHNH